MISLGEHNNRAVFYLAYEAGKPWADALPGTGWMLMVVGKNPGPKKMAAIAKQALAHNPLFIHCCGQESTVMEDVFHDQISENAMAYELSTGKDFDFDETPQTAFDNKLDQGLWFACIAAFHEKHEIEKVVCLDLAADENIRTELEKLVNDFNEGKTPGKM